MYAKRVDGYLTGSAIQYRYRLNYLARSLDNHTTLSSRLFQTYSGTLNFTREEDVDMAICRFYRPRREMLLLIQSFHAPIRKRFPFAKISGAVPNEVTLPFYAAC